MGRIPEDTIQQVRDRVDIVDLVGRFVNLKQAGRNHKGLCPFHNEKTPSFVVTPDRGTFKCFGCGEGGNVFGFLMQIENLSFPEAVRTLAAQHGIEVPETGGDRENLALLYDANQAAHDFYRRQLAVPGNPGARYLEARGIDAETIERFEIGFAPDRWDGVVQELRRCKIPVEQGERVGLLLPQRTGDGHYDRFRNRVVFPIQDVRGRVIGFGGRALSGDQEPKYLNSPESPIFRKRDAFFGFPDALEPIRREERAVVVEGYFDRVALQRAGIDAAVATCGTALTEGHARNLRRRTKNVVLLFDGDEAGQKAMERSLEVLLPAGVRVHAAVLPAGEDPDDFLEKHGASALRQLVDAAPAALDVCIRRAVARGVSTPAEKADAVAALTRLLVLVDSDVERGAYEQQLALAVGAREDDVRSAVRAQRRGDDPLDSVPVRPRIEPAEMRKLRRLARSLLEHPQLAGGVAVEALDRVGAHPVVELIHCLVGSSAEKRSVSIDEIAGGLSDEARSLLYALVAEDLPLDEPDAERIIRDTNRWLAHIQEASAQRALTDEMRNADPARQLEILRAKQENAPSRQSSDPPDQRLH